ncbi:MAG: sulfotransferase domain-containing protein [Nocardioidaceae bacterium]
MGEPVVPPAVRPVRHVEVPDRLRAVKRRTPRFVKRAARRGLRRVGVATADRRVLPNYLVIGTKRGGTTSLVNWLFAHPEVMPMFPAAQQIKSPHYFDLNYWRGLDWYKSHFPTEPAVRRLRDRIGHPPAVGEASPYYMFHPAVPERVAVTTPDVRLIVLLRDPVRRAYSNYWERRGSDAEVLESFEAAIDAEPARLADATAERLRDPRYYSFDHDCHSYLARGRYLEHLRPWLDTFPREQLLVIRSEDLYADPRAVSSQVQRFLGLTETDIDRLDHHNRLPVPAMDAATRQRLVEYYRPHNAALYEALGVDFGWEDS